MTQEKERLYIEREKAKDELIELYVQNYGKVIYTMDGTMGIEKGKELHSRITTLTAQIEAEAEGKEDPIDWKQFRTSFYDYYSLGQHSREELYQWIWLFLSAPSKSQESHSDQPDSCCGIYKEDQPSVTDEMKSKEYLKGYRKGLKEGYKDGLSVDKSGL